MELHVLIAQRKERYPGEYAPEALAVIDGVGNEENPDYLLEEQAKAKATNEFENVLVLRVAVDAAQVARLLRPGSVAISGKVLE